MQITTARTGDIWKATLSDLPPSELAKFSLPYAYGNTEQLALFALMKRYPALFTDVVFQQAQIDRLRARLSS
jgi:hypothetical protein